MFSWRVGLIVVPTMRSGLVMRVHRRRVVGEADAGHTGECEVQLVRVRTWADVTHHLYSCHPRAIQHF